MAALPGRSELDDMVHRSLPEMESVHLIEGDISIEVLAIHRIESALREIECPVARKRILAWALDRFAADEKQLVHDGWSAANRASQQARSRQVPG